MRPENEHLHADRMQSPNDSLTTSDWNANRSAKFEENHTTTNGTNGGGGGVGVGGGHTNGDAILKQRNGGHVDSQTWLPLLSHHVNQIDHNNMPTTNNNKWPALNSPAANLSNSKYTWKELPQDENSIALFKSPANGANALNGLRNVHSDKSEHESLTGIVRSPLNGNHYTNNNENDDHHRLHRYNDNNNDHDDDDVDGNGDDRSNCGIGLCKPKWARMFASTHVFMVIFLLAWILQGMYSTYFVSMITTIEKLFQIKSKTTGLLMSVTEVGQISTALFLTYYAGRGHRPRWIACGMTVFALGVFCCTLPHFIFGDELMRANNAFYGGKYDDSAATSISTSMALQNSSATGGDDARPELNHLNLCRISSGNNSTFHNDACEKKLLLEQEAHSQIRSTVLTIFFFSLLFIGVGQTAVSTLGIPYIDDNVASKESAIYIAITIGVRILGPSAGFILGSFCTRLFVDLSDPGFGPNDPKWVGAWYLGLVMISSLMIVSAMAMFAFPKQLRGHRIPSPHQVSTIETEKTMPKVAVAAVEKEVTPNIRDFPKTIKRQLKNDILMFRTASSVLHLLPIAGLYTFLPKYLESQFHLPAHDANLISAFGGILVMGIGIVISGVVLLKFSPTARSVAAWIAFTALIYSLGMAILMFVGCSLDNFVGLNEIKTQSLDINANMPPMNLSCSSMCECDKNKFSPICGADGFTYFSSCQAGCHASHSENGKTLFTNCECIHDVSVTDVLVKSQAVSGFCDGNCQSFLLFITLFSFFVFVHSTSEVGSMLLIMRCTDPKDKAMAMGIIQFAIGLFGNVPCPIIYGAVIDSTCLIWETICGVQGACSLYDPDAFRHFFLGTTSAIMFLAFIMDTIVWHKAHRIDIDPESKTTPSDANCNEDKPTIVPDTSV